MNRTRTLRERVICENIMRYFMEYYIVPYVAKGKMDQEYVFKVINALVNEIRFWDSSYTHEEICGLFNDMLDEYRGKRR